MQPNLVIMSLVQQQTIAGKSLTQISMLISCIIFNYFVGNYFSHVNLPNIIPLNGTVYKTLVTFRF